MITSRFKNAARNLKNYLVLANILNAATHVGTFYALRL